MSTADSYGELGHAVSYDAEYNPERLFAIPRLRSWDFSGVDIWNHYEVSWLNSKGKPQVAMAQIIYDCHSPNLVESKSLKLYFNSLNNSRFESPEILRQRIEADISQCLESAVLVRLVPSEVWVSRQVSPHFSGASVDSLDISCDTYDVDLRLLQTTGKSAQEVKFCTDLLRSNCPVTNQPDWGSVQVIYKDGLEITPESFLKYIVSYRNHQGFHEQCVEQIFTDIFEICKPDELAVYGRYTRRGGIDINPYRTTSPLDLSDALFQIDLMRQ